MATYETKDLPTDPNLVTRWYACDYKKAKEAVCDVLNRFGYQLYHADDNFCEILFESPRYSTIVKISTLTPLETGIDFYITKKVVFDFKKGITQIVSMYAELDKVLTSKGKGLHANG